MEIRILRKEDYDSFTEFDNNVIFKNEDVSAKLEEYYKNDKKVCYGGFINDEIYGIAMVEPYKDNDAYLRCFINNKCKELDKFINFGVVSAIMMGYSNLYTFIDDKYANVINKHGFIKDEKKLYKKELLHK